MGNLPSAQDPNGWTLAWHSEFDGSALDPADWTAKNNSTYGEGNLELACLMARPDNVSVTGGVLALTARRESPPLQCGTADHRFPDGRAYSSAMVSTQGLHSWTYGLVEVRASLPVAPGRSQGLWPAIWMRPDDLGVGELDVMEALGTGADLTRAGQIYQTAHFDPQGTPPKASAVASLPAGFDPTQFHVYGILIEPGRLQWLVDGAVTFTVDSAATPPLDGILGKPYFLRLNVAVGGRWPGQPDASTELPAALRVDWVRVYQR